MTQYYSRIDTTLNGDVYNIPFSYMKESEISVYINDEPITAWEFLNESQIKINEMPSEIPADAIVSIRRTTDITKKVVDYTNQSMLKKENLNLSQNQLLNAVQEIYDNNVQFEIDTENNILQNRTEIDAQIEANNQELLNIQSSFESEVNTTIETVKEAAEKINNLEQAVTTATSAATTASAAAESATSAAATATAKAEEVSQALVTKEDKANKGVANGYAGLDDTGKVPKAQLPKTIESKITNCLLEVPQRIKLELNNGVLTLKAGSQVIVPNGFEADGTTPKFDYVDVNSDLNLANGTGTEEVFFIVTTTASAILRYTKSAVFSGSVAPTVSTQYACWYDTANNVLKQTINTGATWEQMNWGLPIGVGTTTSTSITSIDQIFNGIGYIGSTVWVDKGIKVLIPNGRNADGTLKNIEVTLTSDKTTTCQYTDGLDIFVNDSAGISANTFNSNQDYYIVDKLSDLPAKSGSYSFCYAINENKMYRNNGTSTWMATKCAYIGKVWCNNSLQIYNCKFKEPVNLLTVSDSSQISGWSMPKRNLQLSLPASSSTVVAPANGYFYLQLHSGKKVTATSNASISLYNNSCNLGTTAISVSPAETLNVYIPVLKNDLVKVYYNNCTTSGVSGLQFKYAKGEV